MTLSPGIVRVLEDYREDFEALEEYDRTGKLRKLRKKRKTTDEVK